MAKIGLDRKKRNIRRIIIAAVIVAAIVFVIIYNQFFPDELPSVRTAVIGSGNLTSRMYVTAEIQPGAVIQHSLSQGQRVLRVHVKPGDQVKAGDILLTLDMSTLEEQYEAARAARLEIERNLDAEAKAEIDRMAKAEQAQREMDRQLQNLTAGLSSAVGRLSQLLYTSPSQLEIDPGLEQYLADFIENMDPENPQQGIDDLLTNLEKSFSVMDNPDYEVILKALESDLQKTSSAAAYVINQLPASFDLADQLSGQISSAAGLDLLVQDPLTQAKAREEEAKRQLDAAVDQLKARSSGIVAAVNAEVGEIAGPAQIQGTNSLEDLLGNSLSGVGTTAAPVVTIYDNLNPLAVFQADRYDAGRIEEGMDVKYKYDDLEFFGKISKQSRIAESSSFNGATGSDFDFFGDVASAGGFSSEPQLRVEMTIKGDNLTDLILGFWIEAEIETERADNVLLLPAEAMRREIDQYYVYVLDTDDIIRRRDFQPGIQSDVYVQILSGLNEGDKVVLNPISLLFDGQEVREITDD